MQCPQCGSTVVRKNGRRNDRQRYYCKDCGRHFLDEGLRSAIAPSSDSASGLAILLLDAENIKFDRNAEQFLATLCDYPLQVKIAFANWKNPSLGQQDRELYERGYQLIHVPDGKNSADAGMIAMGSAIGRHYPEAKAVFVCSCDRLLTHLCNELHNQGLLVYRVGRKDDSLRIENRSTNEIKCYSVQSAIEIPSLEEITAKLEHLLKREQDSLEERLGQLSQMILFVQKWQSIDAHLGNGSRANSKALEMNENTNSVPALENTSSVNNGSTNGVSPQIKSKTELEGALVKVFREVSPQAKNSKIDLGVLGTQFNKRYGYSIKTVLEQLKIEQKFVDFMGSCKAFKLEKTAQGWKVAIAK